jgi:hypothetical protein
MDLSAELSEDALRAVGRAVVVNEDLVNRVAARRDSPQRRGQTCGLVARRNEHADATRETPAELAAAPAEGVHQRQHTRDEGGDHQQADEQAHVAT